MSYLAYCEYKRTKATNTLGVLHTYAVKWRGVTGNVQVGKSAEGTSANGITVYYPRYTRLGALLRSNAESERHFIAEALRKNADFVGKDVSFVSI